MGGLRSAEHPATPGPYSFIIYVIVDIRVTEWAVPLFLPGRFRAAPCPMEGKRRAQRTAQIARQVVRTEEAVKEKGRRTERDKANGAVRQTDAADNL